MIWFWVVFAIFCLLTIGWVAAVYLFARVFRDSKAGEARSRKWRRWEES